MMTVFCLYVITVTIGLMSESSKVESSERDCSRADDFITDIHYYKLHIGCLRGPSEAGDGPPPRQDRLVSPLSH